VAALFAASVLPICSCESLLDIDNPTLREDAGGDERLPDAAAAPDGDSSADTGADAWEAGGELDAELCVPSQCDDGNPCTVDSCSDLGCTHAPLSGVSCSDGNWCNGQETCQAGSCKAGSPPSGNLLVCRTEPCPKNYYTFEYTHRDVCGPSSWCTNARDCRPACGATLTVCCTYDNCVCPAGYVSQGTTKKICFCGTAEGDAIKCARL
jgi:hypothetical protein